MGLGVHGGAIDEIDEEVITLKILMKNAPKRKNKKERLHGCRDEDTIIMIYLSRRRELTPDF